MRISELARKAGIRASAVRFYEKVRVLPPASRQSGQRHFTPEAELYLAVIGFARRAGFTIAEIRLLFHGFRTNTPASARWRSLAQKKHHEIDLQIRNLHGMQRLLRNGMRCRCIRLEDCGRIALSRRNNR
jgi:MerR family transcriptional regulator, redox-sensitive transcriptional activator SoxR